jgi:ADP-ribose pyrophosphatase
VALTQDQQVVLVRQYRHTLQQTLLELPSGAVEATDASPLAAVQRELLEETGYMGEVVIETGRLAPNSATHTNMTHCFLATGAKRVADPVLDEAEHSFMNEKLLTFSADTAALAWERTVQFLRILEGER